MKSIRLFLIIVLLSTICLVNFTAALNGYRSSSQYGVDSLDTRLEQMSLSIAKLTANTGHLSKDAFGDKSIFQIWQGERLLSYSDNAPTNLTTPEAGFHIINAKGVQWRISVHLDDQSNHLILYGERYDLHRKMIDEIILGSILPIIWVLPLIGLLIWLIVGHGLKPIKSFSERLQRRSANELKLINGDDFPKELVPLVESTNNLFGRLSEAFEREQRFSADAAHELRTPLAALKINLHNLAKEHNLSDQNFVALENSAKRMENSIEQLLALYRLSPENFKRTLVPCKLKALAQEMIIERYESIQQKNQSIELTGDNEEIQADVFALSVLIKNLLDNAIKYTPVDGKITIKITKVDENTISINVHDSGIGIAKKDHKKVFERFYRVGQDRHDSGVIGSGLGFSIVAHVVDLHHGKITLSTSKQLGGLAVTVTLPKTQLEGHAP